MARKRIRDEFARAMVRWISNTFTELTLHANNSTYRLDLPFFLLLLVYVIYRVSLREVSAISVICRQSVVYRRFQWDLIISRLSVVSH
jgi:hypothetical protein